jgi:hypothetical protein
MKRILASLALVVAVALAGVAVINPTAAQLINGNTFPFWNVNGPLTVVGNTTLTGGTNAITGTTTIGAGATITSPTITSPTITGTTSLGSGATITNPTIVGTTTNDSAAAGAVGQLITATVASGSAIAGGATTVSKNVTSISLTAGDWDVSGTCDYVWTGITATVMSCGLGTTTDTLLTQAGGGGVGTDPVSIRQATFGTTLSGTQTLDSPVTRVTLASTTTIYLVANMTYSAGSFTQYGTLRARRMR